MKICPLCSKTSRVGGGYSNRIRATKFNPTGKRRRQPNLQRAVFPDGTKKLICTKCLKANKHLTQK